MRVIDVNLKGVFLCMKFELLHMKKHGEGVIVNTSSRNGIVGAAASAGYVSSKHGVLGLTKAAALDYASTGIRVNAICPGVIKTGMTDTLFRAFPGANVGAVTPAGRMGTAEEIAEAVLWLCSDAASYVNGHAMEVDGGWCAQ
jgi:NAD(P)-dependent dehydrogenase (short-subunit alcohol dehydrogenase family)